jgi:TPR repeat protein
MRKRVIAIVALLAFNPLSAPAADFQKGSAAVEAGDWETALKEFQPLAEQGDAAAQYGMAALYSNGYGVPLDFEKAVSLYRISAEQGYADAQYTMGLLYEGGMYEAGTFIPANIKEAMKWYRLAAAQSHAQAQFALGIIYSFNREYPKDYSSAYMWFDLSDANGKETAAEFKADIAERMTQADITKAQEMSAACLASDYENCGY